ncbi:MAG: tetratricopeptide repeat protein [Bacteroidetes bacterium]|nr:tetratricopeptide repeat protein [Bacteroidota bacterium]
MKKQQFILIALGTVLFVGLYFFANTVPPKNNSPKETSSERKDIDVEDILKASKSKLNPSQLSYVNRLENAVVRGDVKNQQLESYRQLASFWKDSVKDSFLPAAYYIGEAAKLENSEKKLTFAAQLFLNNLRAQGNPVVKGWMARQAKALFEKALTLNPENDSVKVGLGATYIFGAGAESPQEVMQGIQKILEVAQRDSTNIYAQFMLGLGGIESGQFDRAIARLSKVVAHQPQNLEAILNLAEAYEQSGDKANAVKWYSAVKKLTNNPELIHEIDQRIKILQ